MQEWYLGWEKVSCLERCSQFRSVFIEREVPHYNYDETVTCIEMNIIIDELAQLHSALSETNEEVGQLVRNWSDRLRTGQTTANKFDQDYK